MAGQKRVAESTDSKPSKKSSASEERASKRLKSTDNAQLSKLAKEANAERKPVKERTTKSVLNTEEKAFPRGGASVLTPLEHKQIQNEAINDVLFEQAGTKRAPREDMDIDESAEGLVEDKTKTKKRRKSSTRQDETQTKEEPKVRAEGLNFKRLTAGSLVFGQVVEITSKDIGLALPNNMTGYVALTSISPQVTAIMERILAVDDKEGEPADDNDEEEDVELDKMFKIGQYLRAFVTSNGSESGGKKRRIELALTPSLANQGLSGSDLTTGNLVQASVESVEDHGLIMDLGLEGDNTKAFLAFDELKNGFTRKDAQQGAVMLCRIAQSQAKGKIVKLSTDLVGEKRIYLSNAPTVNAFLPGSPIEFLVTDVSRSDIRGKIMGLVDVTADHVHSGHPTDDGDDLSTVYKIGSKLKGRVLFRIGGDDDKRLGVSTLKHVVDLSLGIDTISTGTSPEQRLRPSSFIEEAKVVKVDKKLGLFLDVDVPNYLAFAHISQLSDQRVESLDDETGPYKLGSKHRARVLNFNAVDGLFSVSLEQSVLDQPFLRIQDVSVGQVVKGKVERIVVNARGVGGVLVNLAEGIAGLVPAMHMADVELQHPDRKFREGMAVNARVLATDPEKRTVRLTLKKSLVNSDVSPWTTYENISLGDKSPGTIINILKDGAVIQFYGDVRGFLPVAEMSETYIKDPSQHFRVGQVVEVRVLEVDPTESKMRVSCKDPSNTSEATTAAFEAVRVGDVVSATVTAIREDAANLNLDSGVTAILRLAQFTDGSEKKNASAIKKIRASQRLTGLVVLEKLARQNHVVLTNKPSLIKAARNGTLIRSFSDLEVGKEVNGYVRNVTMTDIFIQFAGDMVGLLNRTQLPEETAKLPSFGYLKGQSITARVLSLDPARQRFALTMKEPSQMEAKPSTDKPEAKLINAVDGQSTFMGDYALGSITKARVRQLKPTQLNVLLADNVQGRVDVSEAFNAIGDIKDPKAPLSSSFKVGDIIDVKIIGLHDTRNHRFLPLSHRQGSNPVFELSVKKSRLAQQSEELLNFDQLTIGSTCAAYVNNYNDRSLFVHLSPNVRSRIDFLQLSDNVRPLDEIQAEYPLGSAIEVTIKSVDITNQKVDLVTRTQTALPSSYSEMKEGMILPGRVTKSADSYVMIQLSNSLVGQIPLTDLADDYDQAKTSTLNKNDLVRVCVTHVDASNKKALFSIRPSHVLSSSLPVKDKHIKSADDLEVNETVRGFVANVTDKGLFIRLGHDVTAFVKVVNLFDEFVKDWKSNFQVDQLVKGKIIEIDPGTKNIMMSLKPSHIDSEYTPPLSYETIEKGQIVTAKVRKVEDFGVFLVVDNSNNVSGLCHKSELADNKVEDVKKLYQPGDVVKAMVLKVEPAKRRAAFGLKASYFNEQIDEEGEDEDDEEAGGVTLLDTDEEEEDEEENLDEEDVDLDAVRELDSDEDDEDQEEGDDMEVDDDESTTIAKPKGLNAGGFDWSGDVAMNDAGYASEAESVNGKKPTKKKKKAQIQQDLTGDLDANGPQSVADYERLLLGQPNSSALWVQYMAFQLGLSEVERAREIAERALNTIHIRESDEKKNVWIARLNLEVAFGEDEGKLQEVFEKACQYNDRGEMHERLAGIYIESGKTEKAADLFRKMTKIKSLTQQPSFWLNYATFLMTTRNDAVTARQLLSRATQSVPSNQHLQLTLSFGLLEFSSPNGDTERGRTVFEGLLATFPRRWDLWDAFVDAETSLLTKQQAATAKATPKSKKRKSAGADEVDAAATGSVDSVRDLFTRMSKAKMRPRRAKFVFKRWMEFENKFGDAKGVKKVETVAKEWVEKHAQEGAAANGDEE